MAYLWSAMGLISLNYANYNRKHVKFIHPQGAFLLLSYSEVRSIIREPCEPENPRGAASQGENFSYDSLNFSV